MFDMTDSTLLDVDVVEEHSRLFRLLATNHDAVDLAAWFRSMIDRERNGILKARVEKLAPIVTSALTHTIFAGEAERLGRMCAERALYRWVDMVSVGLALEEQAPIVVGDLPDLDAPCLILSGHHGPYQTLPRAVFRALGVTCATLGDARSLPQLQNLMSSFNPAMVSNVEQIPVPDRRMGAMMNNALQERKPLFILPEFNLGFTGNTNSIVVDFIGTHVNAPTGPANLALRRNAEIYYAKYVGNPMDSILLFTKVTTGDVGSVTRRIFDLVEQQVVSDPTQWWSWNFMEELMLTHG